MRRAIAASTMVLLPILASLACGPQRGRDIDDGSSSSGADAGGGADAGRPDGGGSGGSTDLVETTFRVTVPARTPSYDTVCVAGSAPQLNSWAPCGLALARGADGKHAGTVALARGSTVEFKITRGAWTNVEKDAIGNEIPNRQFLVQPPGLVEITVLNWADEPTISGHVESLGTFESALLKPRPVLVYLPPQYATEPLRRFPVLYMHDGQNLFDKATSFAGEWGVDETAERLIAAGQMEPVIIVAVGNTSDRIDEYTPVASGGYGGGKADLYGRLLVEELKPIVDQRFRTLTDPDTTGLAGSSLGGLVSMYLGMKHSNTFRRLGVVSPSVWWANLDIVARVNALPAKLPLRIWEDIGTKEEEDCGDPDECESVLDARALRDALVAKGWVLASDLSYTEVLNAHHNETAWAARIDDILRYLYPPNQ